MSQYTNQPGSGRNIGTGSVVGTIVSIVGKIVGVIAVLSFLGSIGNTASTAASIRKVSNNTAVRYNESEKTARETSQWEKQKRELSEWLYKEETGLTPAEPVRHPPIDIELKKPDLTRFELKRAEPFVLSERFAEKVMPKTDIPGLEEPRFAFSGDILNTQIDENIALGLSLFSRKDRKLINSIPSKYKTISDIWIEKYLDAHPEYQDILSLTNPVSRNILQPRIRKRNSNSDNHTLISAAQKFSDSMQVTETDISSVNIAEETIMNEFHDMEYNYESVSVELNKYDVTPQAQIQDIPKTVNPDIPAKITAW
jgi:hypothetical protein